MDAQLQLAITVYTQLGSFGTATSAQAAVYLNGTIYKIWGGIGNPAPFVSTVEVYDVSTGVWSLAASLPVATGWHMAAVIGNYIYVAGGLVQSNYETSKTYRYDTLSNTWDDAAVADLPATRWGTASGVVNGQWMLAGGYSNQSVGGTAIAFSTATNTWTSLPSMPQARARMDGGMIGTAFYAVGGRKPSGNLTGTRDNRRLTGAGCGADMLGLPPSEATSQQDGNTATSVPPNMMEGLIKTTW